MCKINVAVHGKLVNILMRQSLISTPKAAGVKIQSKMHEYWMDSILFYSKFFIGGIINEIYRSKLADFTPVRNFFIRNW